MSPFHSAAIGFVLIAAMTPLAAQEVKLQSATSAGEKKSLTSNVPRSVLINKNVQLPEHVLQLLGLRGAPCPEADVYEKADDEPLNTWVSQIVTFQVPANRYLRIDEVAGILTHVPQQGANLKTKLAGRAQTRVMTPKSDSGITFYNYPGKDKPKVPVFVDKGSEVVVEVVATKVGAPGNSAKAWAGLRGCLVDKVPQSALIRAQTR